MIRLLSTCATLCLFSACASTGTTAAPERTAADLGEPSDDVDPELIGTAVRGSAGRFQLCYETGRENNPQLSGRIEIRFVINSDGSVAEAAAAETNLPPQVTSCVVSVFYGLHLPEQEGAVVAQYPMYFHPN